MTTNFGLAPPPKTVDGLLAVPIDIQAIDAIITFDGAAQSGTADVTVQYTVGPTDGYPIFDLRQTLVSAWVDGAALPVGQVASHDFGLGPIAGLRILQVWQAAGSVHTMRLQYSIAAPASEPGGTYPPAFTWSAGPRLRFSFGMTDLYAARYLEAWIPANLIFDQYTIRLDLDIQQTTIPHTVITNGQVATLAPNHWSITFPSRFTALSPLLEVRATDTVESAVSTISLPVSGTLVTIEAWKPAGGVAVLSNELTNIATYLTENENAYGSYLHGNRFVAFFNVGGMEYEGGVTTGVSALRHETFHSWFARGVKPANQADGWWDEAYTTFHDEGADDTWPFSFSDSPVLLCSRNPWQRTTPGNSYSAGSRFWKGMAALLGVVPLNSLMRGFYLRYKGEPVTTAMLEEFLVARGGTPEIVDAFHRFVYGFADPVPPPDLWLKDAPGHAGADLWTGAFWDSPDLWIRHRDDDGIQHQSPEYGQDNWFYARVRNNSTATPCSHFLVTFQAKGYAGTEFIFPQDFLPCVAAKAEFALGPGETRVVKARWPRRHVPRPGSHVCLLASILARLDSAPSGLHAWEHNNLAQKNLTVVDLAPDSFVVVPILLRTFFEHPARYVIELWRDPKVGDYPLTLLSSSREPFRLHKGVISRRDHRAGALALPAASESLDCGGRVGTDAKRLTHAQLFSEQSALRIGEESNDVFEIELGAGKVIKLPLELNRSSPQYVALRVGVPRGEKPGTTIRTHLVQRLEKGQTVTGGVAVEVRVTD